MIQSGLACWLVAGFFAAGQVAAATGFEESTAVASSETFAHAAGDVDIRQASAELADVPTETFVFGGLNLEIPDGDLVGVANTQFISTEITEIAAIEVTLWIEGMGSGAFNGDLYVSLSHESGFAVLLGRAGRSEEKPFGYSDNGFHVTFSDLAPNGDIHEYRVTLNGDHETPITGPLTGLWAPDARVPEDPLSPANIWNTTLRTAYLSSFLGLDPNGDWTLYLVDASSGGNARLVEWGVQVTAVPEPGVWVLGALGAGALALGRRLAGRRISSSRSGLQA